MTLATLMVLRHIDGVEFAASCNFMIIAIVSDFVLWVS